MAGLTLRRLRTLFVVIASISTVVAIGVFSIVESSRADVETAIPAPETPTGSLHIAADYATEFSLDGAIVYVLRGRCRVEQESIRLQSDRMVIWRKPQPHPQRIEYDVYLEGNSRIDQPGDSHSAPTSYFQMTSRSVPTLEFRRKVAPAELVREPLFDRATSAYSRLHRERLIPTTRHSTMVAQGPELRAPQVNEPTGALRRVRIFPRSGVPYNVLSFESRTTTPPEQIWVLTGGINILVDDGSNLPTADLSADRIVIWTQKSEGGEFSADTVQTQDTPYQVYLEGNIVIRQGTNILRATHGFYDARENRAIVNKAELKTLVPALNGNIRIRADRIRQLSRDRFHAQNAWATTSTFGFPGYRLQATDVILENRPTPGWLGGGDTAIDPMTGMVVQQQTPWITTRNNTFLVENVPLFYTPYLSAPAEDPNIPIRRVKVGHDSIFGMRAEVTWDVTKLLGIDAPRGFQWDLQTDVFSDRGPAVGTSAQIQGEGLTGLPGPYTTEGRFYYVNDGGVDNLGLDRRTLTPETDDRYRLELEHRQVLPGDIKLFGELSLISDRNFIEQYYESEFDTGDDKETKIHVEQNLGNQKWVIRGNAQLNEFENTTEWYPRADHYILGQPLLTGLVNWSSHSSAGYGRLNSAVAPTDPTDVFSPLPYVADVQGAVLMTRQSLTAPFHFGPVKVSPYVLGEAAYWSQDINGNSLDRVFGTAGVKSSLMFSKVFPGIYSRIFNLNGIAHKMLLEAEYSYTDSSRGIDSIAQYNDIDDNAQERFRQRFLTNTFGGTLPDVYEPRFYAIRSGAGLSVSAPYHELIDDQQVVRAAWRHRLQTKVGSPGKMRIKDWMTLDLEASFFPDADRDNFGEDFGLIGVKYRWNVGDRTSLLANLYQDLFDNAQNVWNVAVLTQRGQRGSAYVGIRQIQGAGLDSKILSASYTYRMSPKWSSTLGTAYDLDEGRDSGQSITITRIGSDFLMNVGLRYDASKGASGITFSITPRFLPIRGIGTNATSLLGGP